MDDKQIDDLILKHLRNLRSIEFIANKFNLSQEAIEQRIQARKDRNFQLADQIRDQLKEMNIILEDTPQGTRWKRG